MKTPLRSRMSRRAKRNKTARQELKGRAERILKSAHRQSIVIDEPEVWPPEDHIIHIDSTVSVCSDVKRNGTVERPFRRIESALNFIQKQSWTFVRPSEKEIKKFEESGKLELHLLRCKREERIEEANTYEISTVGSGGGKALLEVP